MSVAVAEALPRSDVASGTRLSRWKRELPWLLWVGTAGAWYLSANSFPSYQGDAVVRNSSPDLVTVTAISPRTDQSRTARLAPGVSRSVRYFELQELRTGDPPVDTFPVIFLVTGTDGHVTATLETTTGAIWQCGAFEIGPQPSDVTLRGREVAP